MYRLFLLVKILMMCALTIGCTQVNSSLKNSATEGQSDPSLEIVAIDLISILGQLPSFDPLSMTVQVSPIHTKFGHAIVQGLKVAGYGIQRVSADQGVNHVQYKDTAIIESTGQSNSFEIEIRGIRIVRKYSRIDGRWIPTSSFHIYGVQPSRIVVFNDLHASANKENQIKSGVVFHNADGRVLESRESTVNVSRLDTEPSLSGDANPTHRALLLTQASTFTRQRASINQNQQLYQSIAELILRFPSANPNELGHDNKLAIAKLLRSYNADTDRFVIQGCVKGKTLLWDSTESISLERQLRVNKELIISGVKPESIQELGCVIEETDTPLIEQSVSVVLKRSDASL